jgi:triphosphoribosyl-dephospho-CoA synthase
MKLNLVVAKGSPFDTPASLDTALYAYSGRTDRISTEAITTPFVLITNHLATDSLLPSGMASCSISAARNAVYRRSEREMYRSMNGVPGHAHRIARLAVRSLYHELALYPKPGLVSFRDNGAHRDMDAATFVRSLFSLRGYLVAIAAAGMRDAGFAELQQLGVAAESRMLRATRGINTHRGAIFTHGILAAAAGCTVARNIAPSDENLRKIVAANWSRDLRTIAIVGAATPTHGQLMAARHGATGARGEALQGFPSVFEVALPALRLALARGADTQQALLHTFFALLAETSDTNVLFRGGAEGLMFIQTQAGEFLERGSVFAAGWLECAESLHRQCSARNLSPGGCADLLAAAWFVHQLQTSQP